MKTKLYEVSWSESAQKDLESIIDFILTDSKQNAESVYNQIKSNCQKLEKFPNIGRIPSELKAVSIESYREIIVMNWRILYKFDKEEVGVLAVIDSRRDIDDALLSRMLYR